MIQMHDAFGEGVKVLKTCTTAKEAGSSETVQHNFTFDFEGVTVKHLMDEALRSMVISLQGRVRSALKKTGKPPVGLEAGAVTVKVANLLTGRAGAVVPTVEGAKALIAALSDADREQLIASLRARSSK